MMKTMFGGRAGFSAALAVEISEIPADNKTAARNRGQTCVFMDQSTLGLRIAIGDCIMTAWAEAWGTVRIPSRTVAHGGGRKRSGRGEFRNRGF